MTMLRWSQLSRIEWHCIPPGKPQQNAKLNGRVRNEPLNGTLFSSLDHARELRARETVRSLSGQKQRTVGRQGRPARLN